MSIFNVITYTGGMSWRTGMECTRKNFDILETEVAVARGSADSIGARLNNALNADGTPIAAVSGVDWSLLNHQTLARSSNYVFTVVMNPAQDLTATLLRPGRRVKLNNSSTNIGTIKTATYAAPTNTITLFDDVVPATPTSVYYGITHLGDPGSIVPVEPLATKPAWDEKYACRFIYALDTGNLWFGDHTNARFTFIGGNMLLTSYANSHFLGGTAVTVQNGVTSPLTTTIDFASTIGTGTVLSGTIKALRVIATDRAADSSTEFDVAIYGNVGLTHLIAAWENIDLTVTPYGLELNDLNLSYVNADALAANKGKIYIKCTNNLAADTSVVDIELEFEYATKIA